MEGDIGYNERQRFVSSEKDPLCISSVTKFVVKTYRGTLPRRIVLIEATISFRRPRFYYFCFLRIVVNGRREILSTREGKKLSFIDSFTINVTTRIIIPR